VAFDHGKAEAAIFRRRKTPPTTTAKVGANTVPFNKEGTLWLGVWLDSQLTLRDHYAIRLKNRKNAMARLRRLARQMRLSPANCRKVTTARTQSVTMFGSELWWKGGHTRGTIGQANELQLLAIEKRERRQAASGQATLAPRRWSQGPEQRQHRWKTGSGGSASQPATERSGEGVS